MRRHLRKAAIAGGALFALTALLFLPPLDRALGGMFSRSEDGAVIANFPDRLRGQFVKRNGDYVPYSHIPACLEQALISVEDKRFLLHGGIDPIALVRASLAYVRDPGVDHGGSTITLQLARIMLHVPRRQPSRVAEVESELRVMRGALIVEHDFSKQMILELYLNSVYFGRGATGAAAAAEAYFHVPLAQLNEAQCIYMAGLPNAPAVFGADPFGRRTMARYRHVIATMQRNRYLTGPQALALNRDQLLHGSQADVSVRPGATADGLQD